MSSEKWINNWILKHDAFRIQLCIQKWILMHNIVGKKLCEIRFYEKKKKKVKSTQMAFYFHRDFEVCLRWTLFGRTSCVCVERRCILRPNAIPKSADGGLNACGKSLGINPKENVLSVCVFSEDRCHRVSAFERESLRHQLSLDKSMLDNMGSFPL